MRPSHTGSSTIFSSFKTFERNIVSVSGQFYPPPGECPKGKLYHGAVRPSVRPFVSESIWLVKSTPTVFTVHPWNFAHVLQVDWYAYIAVATLVGDVVLAEQDLCCHIWPHTWIKRHDVITGLGPTEHAQKSPSAVQRQSDGAFTWSANQLSKAPYHLV